MTNYSNYWSHGYVSGNTDYYEKDKSIILSTNSYFAWKQTWKNEYIGAFMKAMPEAYKNDATHGVLTISRLV